jgi:predicted protein tyrosine phosphatase
MIKQVRVYCRKTMNDVVLLGHKSFPYEGQRWSLVSIHTNADKFLRQPVIELLNKKGMSDHLSLRFWDATNDPKPLRQIVSLYHQPILFDEKMADEVVKFVDKIIAEKDPIIFIAHCDAGISRSGAIALFAVERAGLDIGTYFQENPKVNPNPFVLRLLHKAASMNYIPMTAAEAAAEEQRLSHVLKRSN